MKKLSLLVMPLMITPFLICCGNNGGGESDKNTLCFTCNSETADLSYYLDIDGEPTSETYEVDLEFSIDGIHWTKAKKAGTEQSPQLIYSFKKGESLYLRGNNPNGWCFRKDDDNGAYVSFYTTSLSNGEADFSISGNIMSLISHDYKNLNSIPNTGCFSCCFFGTDISDASNLELPATQLTPYCYGQLFLCCEKLVKAPSSLPASSLTPSCYVDMFYDCRKLKTAPIFPTITLSESSCETMFWGCNELDITKDTGKNKFFTCPSNIPNNAVKDMFKNTRYSGDPTPDDIFFFN